jgi:hypothetical protein
LISSQKPKAKKKEKALQAIRVASNQSQDPNSHV